MNALDMILKAGENGKFFTVVFIKRTTGEKRVMNCRLGVRKYVNGVGLAYDPEKKNLCTVYDVKSKGYRMINLDSVLEINGQTLTN